MTSTVVIWDERMRGYDLGRTHPLHPVRLELTIDLADRLGVLAAPGVTVRGADLATDDLLGLVHDADYLSAIRRAPDDWTGRLHARYGLATPDNPVFPRMYEASALVTGGTLAAAEAVWTGEAEHAVNIAGGLHHAMRDRASGFCVFNDPAIAISRLLARGATRIAYIDVDVHHGDGVQAAFYDDPRVLTISLHQSGTTLFPGTGFAGETGLGAAEGTAVNVPLPPYTGDAGWLRAFSGVVPVLLRAFDPELIVSQHGCDSHREDPLADLSLSVDGQRQAYELIHELAHEVCGGRWVACGGGGYALASVVPRAWTHLLAIAGHVPLAPDTAVPQPWREHARDRVLATTDGPATHAGLPPDTMSDGPAAAYLPWDAGTGDPDDALDRSVALTRNAILPLHGLDPLVDR